MGDPFANAIARSFAALKPPARVLLAVSGGADSIAMLDALALSAKRRDLAHVTWVVGHFDHALRSESRNDAELVQRHAGERNLRFMVRRRLTELAQGLSLEHAARELRYAALLEMAREASAGAIVTAHTATDQVETLLWRIARGTGPQGLGGIRAERALGGVRLLRPMLGLTREETRRYCADRGISFNDDPTNMNDLPRARIREEIVPVLERLYPGAVGRIAATVSRQQEDEELLSSLAAPLLCGPAEVLLQSLRAAPRPLRMRALALWMAESGVDRSRLSSVHLEALGALVLTGRGEVELPADRHSRQIARVVEGMLVREARPHVRQQGVEEPGGQPHLPATDGTSPSAGSNQSDQG